IIPPDNFVQHPQYGSLYLLDWRKKRSGFPLVGNKTWKDYRVELEILPASKRGFLGLNFHAQSDGLGACNVHFPLDGSGRNEVFQAMGIWGKSGSWKLYPESQAYALFPTGQWIRLRLDITGEFANLYAQGSSRPLLTLLELPYSSGGIQFWSYLGSGYFRNLRVTQLSPADIVPGFDSPWDIYADLNVIRTWQVTPPQKPDFGSTGIPEAVCSSKIRWIDVEADRKGVVNLSRLFPEKNRKAAVFAKAIARSVEKVKRICRLTYTDRLTIWCNGVQVFKGPPRGWNDPDRDKHFGGRLIPDEYEVKIMLEPGDSTILLRSEVTEPFGWGFWMRID
ncbi:MAG: hypothetical protein HY731_05480, partial [Candidatus Tectomicrobia bacterium]|nr:hypothetical protein [Candidatus Tectomicrobia bacterium]